MTLQRIVRGLVVAILAGTSQAQTPDLYDLDTVREFRLYFAQPNYWQLLQQNYASKTNIDADLKVDGRTYSRVGVRFRGNTSYRSLPAGSEKAGFNIELDANIVDQNLYGYDHLNLNNGFHDPTFMREPLTYLVCRRYMCAPKANWVKVYLNDQYWGIYINVQQPNKDMMKEWFRTNDGNRYRGFPGPGGRFDDSALNYLGNIASNYLRGYEFKQGDGTDLMRMITVLTQTPSAQLLTELPKVWSIDQSFWYFACMNALAHTDSYIGTGKDHFHYHDEVHDTFHIFPFDVNESLGGEGGTATLDPYSNFTNTRRPAMSRVLPLGNMRQRYNAHYRTVLNEILNWNYIGGLVTKYQNMIRADVIADTKKIYSTALFDTNVTQNFGRILALKPLVEQREQFLRRNAELTATEAQLSNLALNPARPSHNNRVTVTVRTTGAAGATLFYRVKGPFIEAAMFDDGQHGDGAANDGVFGAFIPGQPGGSQVDYYVGANTAAGVLSFLPNTAEFQAPHFIVDYPRGNSPIVISELLAKNDTGIQDGAGEREDWLELHNTSTAPVSVAGMYLTDDPADTKKWQIPANISIPAGDSLLIWCDGDLLQGPLHAGFKLAAEGERVMLFASDGATLLDEVTFGPQLGDISFGRLIDNRPAPLVTFSTPTPSGLNAPGSMGFRAYSAQDPTANTLGLAATGIPKIGNTISLQLQGAPANGAFLLLLSASGGHLPFLGKTVLLTGPIQLDALIPASAAGTATLNVPIPNVPGLAGVPVYLQPLSADAAGLLAGNAVEVIAGR